MSEKMTLSASHREATGKTSRPLAGEGRIPAVVYGAEQDALSLSVDRREFERFMHHASVGSTLVDLEVEGRSAPLHVIIKEVQHDEVKGFPRHIDFWAVRMGKSIQTVVAITTTGSSLGEREGGTLMQALRELHIEARPGDLPEAIEVDVSELNIGDSLTVGTITPPKGVTILDDPETLVVSIAAPTVEVEEAEEAEIGAAEVPEIGEKTADSAEE